MNVAIYCRVSSAEQERKGTIEAQRRTLTSFASQAGYHVTGIYEDDGKSAGTGKLADRTGYARLLVAAERREFDAVLVVSIDRLTRTDDLIERASILGPLQRAGVQVITPSGTIDLRTFTGDLMAGLEAAMAALERKKILERTQGGKERLLAAGGKPHGLTPYGLHYDRDAKRWSVDEERAAVIREIHERVAGEESCVRIALDLHARKVPPPGKQWGHTSVWSLVRQARDRYAGTWLANERRGISVPVPRILTDEQIDRAELALHDHKRRGLEKRTRGVYLLDRHQAVCGRCGGWIGVRGHGSGRDASYTCRNRSAIPAGSPGRCSQEPVLVRDLDPWLWAEVSDLLTRPALVSRALSESARRQSGDDGHAQALAEARRRLADLDRRAAILGAKAHALPPEVLSAALDRVAQERAESERGIRSLELAERNHGPAVADVEQVLEELRTRAASAPPEERRAIVRTLVPLATLTGRLLKARLGIGRYPVDVSSSTTQTQARGGSLRILAPRLLSSARGAG